MSRVRALPKPSVSHEPRANEVPLLADDATSAPKPTKQAADCDLLIVGASFTGVELLHQLRRRGTLERMRTIVVDRRPVHAYIPLAHEVATGRGAEDEYRLDTRAYVHSLPNCSYLVAEVTRIDAVRRTARLASGRELQGRTMVIALGSELSAPSSLDPGGTFMSAKFGSEISALRERLESDTPNHVVVVGGGITGVEMAGEIAEWRAKNEHPCNVTLAHGGPALLHATCPGAARLSERLLEQLGVEVHTETRVESVDSANVVLHSSAGNTTHLPCDLVLWGGGISPTPLTRELELQHTSAGWLRVDEHLRCLLPGADVAPGVFAGGDAVRVWDGAREWPTMQRAIECIWQGRVLAKNVTAYLDTLDGAPSKLTRHKLRRHFPYGVSIGKHSLVVYRRLAVNLRSLGVWFRRWLMRQYFRRYRPR